MPKNNQDNQKSAVAKREEAILSFWRERQIFAKTVATPAGAAPKADFVFYDGPPFATGTPHFGHLLPTSIKDAIPRYQTMNGRRVLRRWGWDCHGLPVENIVEKELNLQVKKDIEEYGVDRFNQAARESVLRYTQDWEQIVPRMGRWVDMDNDYRTMDSTYTESIWWVFKTLYDRGLIYEGYKSMHICPRCETTLANFEVNQGYKDVTDISVTVKFELIDEPGTFFLAWTTTPWTLPGNVALAVNPEINYVKVKTENKDDSEPIRLILAEERLKDVLAEQPYSVIKQLKGDDLIGKKYRPVFDYYARQADLENKANGWQVYGASFVTTEEGTGIVHLAPAFGEDDYQLALKEKLPFIQHVALDGRFKDEVADFAGQSVKPKDEPQQADILIIKYLAQAGRLWAKKKIVHSYPHCWRCDTPLLNYAASSWFVKVSAIKDRIVAANQKVNWVPNHIKNGRFGKWLENARDWAISRSRFWGAPLPVWKCDQCDQVKVFGSVAELAGELKTKNNYLVMRHGQSKGNLDSLVSSLPSSGDHLTADGQKQAAATADRLVGEKVDLIIHSGFERTKETAAIVADKLGLSSEQVITDEQFAELNTGDFAGKTWPEYWQNFADRRARFFETPPGGESIEALSRRVMAGLAAVEEKYAGQNILIITHAIVSITLELSGVESDINQVAERYINKDYRLLDNAEYYPLVFKPLPRNERAELDLHRPFIDRTSVACVCGGQMTRVADVFDCWFESGSMPYGQAHYPFTKEQFDPERAIGFPADFIAEGLDQTRGWFYSLLVLSTALFDQPPYQNVVVNGLILAEDGQKMSKRLKNYPDLNLTIDKYGADALRLYLLASPAVHADDFSFSETGLAEVYRKNILRLENVLAFYLLYADQAPVDLRAVQFNDPLDTWIVSRLAELASVVADNLDRYEVDKAVRPLDNFIDDLSTWYIRRSRDRFKSTDERIKQEALTTTAYVLSGLAKVLAPLAPFLAEHLHQSLVLTEAKESVHLEAWPHFPAPDQTLLEQMTEVRSAVEEALAQRAVIRLKVRQPLSLLKIKSARLKDRPELLTLISEEVNVKQTVIDESLTDPVWLDTTLTPELEQEGLIRELIRQIQKMRKDAELDPSDLVTLTVYAEPRGLDLIRSAEPLIRSVAGVKELVLTDQAGIGSKIVIGDRSFLMAISKL